MVPRDHLKAVISDDAAKFFLEDPCQRHTAVVFRGAVYVACPRHMDAIKLAFSPFTEHQRHRISQRISEGHETMLFGHALGDGTGWRWDEDSQGARMIMYGFD